MKKALKIILGIYVFFILLAVVTGETEWIDFIVGLSALFLPYVAIFLALYSRGKKRSSRDGRSDRNPARPAEDCPKPVCFHRDRGEHHVRKGREIDPWDRPDIDPRKYRRK